MALGSDERPQGPAGAVVWVRIASLILMGALMTRLAWLSDDSLITLRTALNVAHGWGFGFNPDEAVQGYTHPLWFLLWTGIGALTQQWVLGVLTLGIALSMIAVAVVLWRAPVPWLVVAAALSLVVSNAFMEYTTSGLENPLAYALAAVAIVLSRRYEPDLRPPVRVAGLLGLSMAGLALTRLDLVLIVAPVAALLLWRTRRSTATVAVGVAAATLPILVWLSWSWSTYSSLLPNTFEAKRNLDIPALDVVKQGAWYLIVSGREDPWTVVVLTVTLALCLVLGTWLLRAWAAGTALYLGYVVLVGGDFMAGRFLAVPVLVSVAAAVELGRDRWIHAGERVHRLTVARASLLCAGIVLACLAAVMAPPTAFTAPAQQRWSYDASHGVADERGFFVGIDRGVGGVLAAWHGDRSEAPVASVSEADPVLRLVDVEAVARRWPSRGNHVGDPIEVGVACGLLGSLAISTGPHVHWIDSCGLTDAFIAELPFVPDEKGWRPGHFSRPIPEGYVEAVEYGDASRVVDPSLRRALADLWRAIR